MVPIQSGPEERMMVHWHEKKKETYWHLFFPCRLPSFSLPASDWAVRCEEEEEEEEEAGLFSSFPPPLPNYLLGPSSFMLLL